MAIFSQIIHILTLFRIKNKQQSFFQLKSHSVTSDFWEEKDYEKYMKRFIYVNFA